MTKDIRGRVLIVDDDAMISKALNRLLRKHHEVVSAHGGKAAFQVLQIDDSFDVILCDIMMPEMTGIELYQSLQQVRPDLINRIIFMTGGTYLNQMSDFLAKLQNIRIEKPIEMKTLLKHINSIIQQHRVGSN